MIVCRRWKEPIQLLAGGRLEESVRPALLRHMEQCDKCRSFCRDLQELETALRAPVPEEKFLPQLEIRSIVERSINFAERKPIPVRRTNPFFHGPRIAWGFAATVLVFLCGYSFHDLLEPGKTSSPQIASTPDLAAKSRAASAPLKQAQAKSDSGPLAHARSSRSGAVPLSQEDLAVDRHYAIANRLLKSRNFAGAAAALQKFLALHAVKRDKAMLDLAYCYGMLDQPQRALPIYTAVAKGSHDPKAVETAYNRIDSLLDVRLGAYANAEENPGVPLHSVPAGLRGQRGKYYLVQMPIRKEDSAKVNCLLEQFRHEIPHGGQAPGMSPQIINVRSPWTAPE